MYTDLELNHTGSKGTTSMGLMGCTIIGSVSMGIIVSIANADKDEDMMSINVNRKIVIRFIKFPPLILDYLILQRMTYTYYIIFVLVKSSNHGEFLNLTKNKNDLQLNILQVANRF